MIFFHLLYVFLSLVITAVIQVSFGVAELIRNGSTTTTIETGFSPNTTTTTTEAITAHPPVVTSTSTSMDLVTSSSLDEESTSGTQIKHDGISMPDSTTLLRTFYVLVAVTAIIIIYFVVRTVRLRMRKNRKTRYGLLSTHDDGIEMRHLEEDEEDATVFDRALSHSRR